MTDAWLGGLFLLCVDRGTRPTPHALLTTTAATLLAAAAWCGDVPWILTWGYATLSFASTLGVALWLSRTVACGD